MDIIEEQLILYRNALSILEKLVIYFLDRRRYIICKYMDSRHWEMSIWIYDTMSECNAFERNR